MTFEFIRYEKREHVVTITIDRPEVLNALHPDANEELARAWDAFAADDELRVAILTGAGDRAFSAGNDLKWTARHGMPRLPKGGFGGITARFDLWKPVIAAVNGLALGGGLEIALACDIIVAAEHATFGLPEPRVGLMAAAGGVHRLPRHIPLKIAMGMILTGKPITASEARRSGGRRRSSSARRSRCRRASRARSRGSAARFPRRSGPPTNACRRCLRARTGSRGRARLPRSASPSGRGAEPALATRPWPGRGRRRSRYRRGSRRRRR